MKKLFLMMVLMLSACSTENSLLLPDTSTAVKKSPASGKELEKARQSIDIAEELLQECEKFSSLRSSNPSPNDVLAQKAKDVAVYNACARRHRSLVKIVRDAFNIPHSK